MLRKMSGCLWSLRNKIILEPGKLHFLKKKFFTRIGPAVLSSASYKKHRNYQGFRCFFNLLVQHCCARIHHYSAGMVDSPSLLSFSITDKEPSVSSTTARTEAKEDLPVVRTACMISSFFILSFFIAFSINRPS